MADKKRPYYGKNGAAVYDIYETGYDANAARQLELPAELPQESNKPLCKQKVKAKLVVKPFALLGSLAVACLLSMVVFGYVQVYEATSQAGELRAQLTQVEADNAILQSSYESNIQLTAIEQRAKELGMKRPAGNQQVYLNISANDRAEVLHTETQNIFVRTWSAVRDSFMGMLEYFI